MFGTSFTPDRDIPDLAGKVILVTGGNSGLGKEPILQLARHNPSSIYLAARSQQKAELAISEIQAAVPNAPVTFLPLDLGSLTSVKEAANKFLSEASRLDILMNNAGIMAVAEGKTSDGYEIQFGTNYIGHFYLTKLLLPTLLKTSKEDNADMRIVNLSSDVYRLAPSGGINFDDLQLQDKGGWTRYGQSKLANILFTRELARRHPGIKSVALHPGLVKTNLASSTERSVLKYGMSLLRPFVMQDTEQGAKNQLWAAVSSGVENGGYYTPIGSKSAGSAYVRDQKLAEKLWDWTEGTLKKRE